MNYLNLLTLIKLKESNACLEKIVFPESWKLKVDERNNTLRFYPKDVGTSGMFIAKIRKKKVKVIF